MYQKKTLSPATQSPSPTTSVCATFDTTTTVVVDCRDAAIGFVTRLRGKERYRVPDIEGLARTPLAVAKASLPYQMAATNAALEAEKVAELDECVEIAFGLDDWSELPVIDKCPAK